jgi:uncharacterized protein YqeY
MKDGRRDRAVALRMVANALQQEAKEGEDDETAVLRRERKKRLEAAEAFRRGGSEDRAASEESEARMIEEYLPQQLSDSELDELVTAAIEQAGASGPRDLGKVMSALMPRVGARADGKRVSGAVRERLGGAA